MPDFQTEFTGAQVSHDTASTTLRFTARDGTPVTVQFPSDELDMVMLALAQAAAHTARIRQSNPRLKKALPVDWWEIGRSSPEHVLMSFRIEGGIEASFQLHDDAAKHFREVLSTLLGIATPEIPPGPKN